MTDKQIIIDGVDIKDCKRRIGKDNFCRYYKRTCAENNYNCIWKKYLRKEQECEELKSDLTDLSKIIACKNGTILTFKEQLDQLKVDREQALKQLEFVRTLNTVKETEIRKLSKTLAEIKEIAENVQSFVGRIDIEDDVFEQMEQILQKISECEVNND